VTLSTDMQDLKTKLGSVIQPTSWKMVYAKDQTEFDTLWKQLQADCKEIGLKTCVDYLSGLYKSSLESVSDYTK
jgi:putative aldouronate transport system substrate-binding protein